MKTKLSAWFFSLFVLSILPALLQAAPPQILSLRDAALPTPAGGNGDSVSPVISPDGRFVLFGSTANNLISGGDHFYRENVYLRDRASNITTLVSANLDNSGGGNGFSLPGDMSTNGQFVAFQSDASNLVPDDTNEFTDIFVRNLVGGTTTLVSVSTNGDTANGYSTDPVITPDGRYVVFLSTATDLVPDGTGGIQNVFVRDLGSDTTTLVSVNAGTPVNQFSGNPVMATPVITPDGHYVAFFSSATGLAPAVPSSSGGEVYLRDLQSSTTTWVSSNAVALASSLLNLSNAISFHPQISHDGRYVAFQAGLGTNNSAALILQYDTATSTTTVVNTNGAGWYVGQDDANGPEMTPDGRFIAFAENEGAPSAGYSSVYLWDAQTGTNTLVSSDGDGVPTNTVSQMPIVTPDGQFVTFLSNAANLATNAISSGFHIYQRNMNTGVTQLIDADTNGVGATDETMTSLSVSSNGQFVASSSLDGGLVNDDINHVQDVFVRDTTSTTTKLVSQHNPAAVPQTANGLCFLSPLSISADGRWAIFTSAATDLVPDDTNNATDVFVRDLVNGTNLLASVGYDGGSALGGNSGSAVISSNGRYVVFISSATNLVAGVAGTYNNVYRRDLQTSTTVLISVGTDGTSPGNGDASDPTISPDGRFIAFLSQASNLASGITSGINTYWRDVQLGQTIGLIGNEAIPPTLGDDGRYVAYSGNYSLCIFDTQRAANIYTNSGPAYYTSPFISAALSPDGTKIFYQSNTFDSSYNLYVDSFTLQTNQLPGDTNYFVVLVRSNLFSMESRAANRRAASWSDDGRWLAFVDTTNWGAGDDGQSRVYLKDFQTATLSLIGLAGPGTNGLAASSDGPAISGNGRFIAYRSTAVNLAAGGTAAPPNEFLFDRVTGSNTLLTAGQSISTPAAWMSRPSISDGGSTIAFLNWNSGLPAGDASRQIGALESSVDINAALVDSDSDGIPDWWMMKYFGHPAGDAADSSLALDDKDGDGMSNLQEYLTGTSPVDGSSVFRLVITPRNGQISLSWPGTAGKSYEISYKTSLTDSVWLSIMGTVWVGGGLGQLTLPVNHSHRFYRLFESN